VNVAPGIRTNSKLYRRSGPRRQYSMCQSRLPLTTSVAPPINVSRYSPIRSPVWGSLNRRVEMPSAVAASRPDSEAVEATSASDNGFSGRRSQSRSRFARCKPAHTLSRIRSLSNSAVTPNPCSCSRPAALWRRFPLRVKRRLYRLRGVRPAAELGSGVCAEAIQPPAHQTHRNVARLPQLHATLEVGDERDGR
jgi:hypothetical protein